MEKSASQPRHDRLTVIDVLWSSDFSERMFGYPKLAARRAGKTEFRSYVGAMFGPPPSDVLAPVIGARLDRADVQWHVIPGQDDSLIRFWLTFDSCTFGFHVGADR